MATPPPAVTPHYIDEKWDKAIDSTLKSVVYGGLIGGVVGLVLFREWELCLLGSHDERSWVPVHRQGKYTWYVLAQGEGLFARLPWLLALGLALGAPTSRTSGRCVGRIDSAWLSAPWLGVQGTHAQRTCTVCGQRRVAESCVFPDGYLFQPCLLLTLHRRSLKRSGSRRSERHDCHCLF